MAQQRKGAKVQRQKKWEYG